MGMDCIKRPLWTCKLSNEKLLKYLDELNEFEIKGNTDSELLLTTADTWYDNAVGIDRIIRLANDVYKEDAFRFYEGNVSRFR